METYISYLADYLSKWNPASEVLKPILMELTSAGEEGSLCVPMKPEWKKSLTQNSKPFVVNAIKDQPYIYFEKVFTLKARLENALRSRIANSKNISFARDRKESILNQLEDNFKKSINANFKLNEGQRNTIDNTLSSTFQIISGGPGTGKTTVIAFILKIMEELGVLPSPDEIALVAPTGRAAQRLTEAIQENLMKMSTESKFTGAFRGQTVHSLLSFRPHEGKFYYDINRSLPYRLIIVDEVSMVDLNLMVSLFEALPKGDSSSALPFRLLLLGDLNQLPSVEKGEVLADFLTALHDQSSLLSQLTESNRQKVDSRIYKLTKEIYPDRKKNSPPKQGTVSNIDVANKIGKDISYSSEVVWFEASGFGKSEGNRDSFLEILWKEYFTKQIETIQSWNLKALDDLKPREIISDFKKELNQFRCLTIFRSGFYGVEGIHAKIDDYADGYLRKKKNMILFRRLASSTYYEGKPILITKNDKNRKLYNGDVGLVLRIGDELKATFVIDDLLYTFALDTLPEHEPAYFMTVHKSQGSEYDTVLLFVPERPKQKVGEMGNKDRLITRKILYTGITRAKSQVILFGSRETWEFGLSNDVERITGFNLNII